MRFDRYFRRGAESTPYHAVIVGPELARGLSWSGVHEAASELGPYGLRSPSEPATSTPKPGLHPSSSVRPRGRKPNLAWLDKIVPAITEAAPARHLIAVRRHGRGRDPDGKDVRLVEHV